MQKVLLITDYKGSFYSSTTNTKTLCTMNVQSICKYFSNLGINTEINSFSNLNLNKDYEGVVVLYTSSEDEGTKYKSYIEDIVLFLKEKGAILIPDYKFLRSHHNKSFMEMLRYKLLSNQRDMLNTKVFGTFEELLNSNLPDQKYVIKAAFGAGSKYVKRAENKKELLTISKKMSKGNTFNEIAKEYRSRLFWKGYYKQSLNRNKFIIQDFIEGLKGDFKVLKYGKRFYTLYRENRANDFRASGSGRLNLEMPNNIDENALLDFAREASDRIGTPLCSMDIAFNGSEFILIEFQCLNFGPYTAEKSSHYHIYLNNSWHKVDEKCDLELVFCEAISDYIKNI